MHRGSLAVAALSLLGGCASFVIAAALHNPLSLYTVLGIVLLANALVRYLMARGASRDDARDR